MILALVFLQHWNFELAFVFYFYFVCTYFIQLIYQHIGIFMCVLFFYTSVTCCLSSGCVVYVSWYSFVSIVGDLIFQRPPVIEIALVRHTQKCLT